MLGLINLTVLGDTILSVVGLHIRDIMGYCITGWNFNKRASVLLLLNWGESFMVSYFLPERPPLRLLYAHLVIAVFSTA